jgi:c-di-GMP-binding flagellar brake protein YcgR
MADIEFLVPVRKLDIELGKPLTFAAYDSDQNLLLNSGVVITSLSQVEKLLEKGLFRQRVRPKTDPDAYVRDEKTVDKAAKPQGGNLKFDAIKLMPGDALQLQSLLEGQNERFSVSVIGVMKQKSILVSAPMVDGKLIFVRDGQTYMVRAFSGLNVVAFKARIVKSQLQPYPYMHLSYPDNVQVMKIRKAMRAPANIIVAVHENEGSRQFGAGRIVDLSIGGARMFSPMKLGAKDQEIWLSFKVFLVDMEEYVKTPAIIRAVGEEDDEQGKRMNVYGLQFGELEQSQRLIIMNLVYQHLLKDVG